MNQISKPFRAHNSRATRHPRRRAQPPSLSPSSRCAPNSQFLPTPNIARQFRVQCYHNKSGLTAGIIVAGWDKTKGGQVYSIPVGGAILERQFAIGGSGSTYIYGFCDAYFKPGMTRDQCEEFTARSRIRG